MQAQPNNNLDITDEGVGPHKQAKIVDVDGSYTHRKYVCLKEAGAQVLMPSNPPPP